MNSCCSPRFLSGRRSAATSGLSVQTQTRSLHDTNTSLQVNYTKNNTGTVEIKRIVLPMRGGSQARLVQGWDDRHYVAKFVGNPQGHRTLVNEWIAQIALRELGISTPELRVLRLPESFRDEALCFEVGNKKMPVTGDWHLGSLCPANPETQAIFDFLPRRLMNKIVNLDDFAKIFVFDRWTYQTDTRQAVFVREPSSGAQSQFRAYFIDQGAVFSGSSWELHEAAGHGLYADRDVYSLVNMQKICEETVSQIEALSEEKMSSALTTIPQSWLKPGDSEALQELIRSLFRRRNQLRRIVTSQLTALRSKGYSAYNHAQTSMLTTIKKPIAPTSPLKATVHVA